MRRRKGKNVTRTKIEIEMKYFFERGGEIHLLPPQVFIPVNRVNCASPYLDYRDTAEEFNYQP